jgi:hypothetical protein
MNDCNVVSPKPGNGTAAGKIKQGVEFSTLKNAI